ncbi:DUF4397 domain-containing protein [Chitinophaga sp. 212800010-3]|uniref:DUF4397 domain-containing protein n=1 Tax=unclassified Chitinophaga TaxID=2619133 RepID=UPI002DE824BB|nr:DUF4397 domain-containing protein [Chitinophaga sp. 212800010-3]
MLIKKNRIWAVVALLTGVIGFSSCLKNNNVTPQRPMARVLVFGVSNNAVPATFYDNNQKITGDNASVNFNFVGTYAVYGGDHIFELRKKGADSVITTTQYTFDSTSYYTYFIVNNNPVRSLVVKSDFSTADQQKINIRFLNLSTGNSDPVDFYIGTEKADSNRLPATMPDLASATSFAKYSSFSVNNSITVKKAGTDQTLATVSGNDLKTGSLTVGNVYTVYYAGTTGSTGADKLMVNAVYNYW